MSFLESAIVGVTTAGITGTELAALLTALTGIAALLGKWWGERRGRQERQAAADLEKSVAVINAYAQLVKDLQGQVDWQAKAHGADRASWATERAELRARIAKLEKQVRELRGQLERRGEDTGAPSGIGDRRGPTGAKRD